MSSSNQFSSSSDYRLLNGVSGSHRFIVYHFYLFSMSWSISANPRNTVSEVKEHPVYCRAPCTSVHTEWQFIVANQTTAMFWHERKPGNPEETPMDTREQTQRVMTQ